MRNSLKAILLGFLLFAALEMQGQTTAITYGGTVTVPIGTAISNLPKWSSPSTWTNGVVPNLDNLDVIIPPGAVVVIDQDITFQHLMVHGKIVVDPGKDVRISAHSIQVMGSGSYFEWGTETFPYLKNGILTLTAANSAEVIPMMGFQAKAIMAEDGGTIEIHGKNKTAWTVINATALAGSNTIVLKDPVNWSVGDSIVIASSDREAEHNEAKKISAISPDNLTITLTDGLKYQHWGKTEIFTNGKKTWILDERAEVGVLSRNILIQGDAQSEQSMLGGYVMIMTNAVAHVSGVELYRMGLSGVLARYPFHWHTSGDAAGQYFKNSTVHRGYNRAITVHGSNNALVQSNVVYDILGHAIFIEDGIETGNTFDNNLIMSIRMPAKDKALTGTDLADIADRVKAPAAIWITNPDNTFTNNHISGAGSGLWFGLPNYPTGLSYTTSVHPRNIPIRKCDLNVTHSSTVGITFDYSNSADTKGVEAYGYEPSVLTVVPNVQAYKCARGIWFRGGSMVEFSNFVLADNTGNGAFVPTNHTKFYGGCIIGHSANNVKIDYETFGNAFYDGPEEVRDCHFVNFDQYNQSAFNIFGGAYKWPYAHFSGLTFSNCNLLNPNSTLEFSPMNSFVMDDDGSTTGTAGAMMCLDHPFIVDAVNFTKLNEKHGWGMKTNLRFGQFNIDRQGAVKNAMLYYEWGDGHAAHETGVPGSNQGQAPVVANSNRIYKVRFCEFIPASVTIDLRSFYRAGDRVNVVIQGAPEELLITGSGITKVTSLAALQSASGNASYWANNELNLNLIVTGGNENATASFTLSTISGTQKTPLLIASRPFNGMGQAINSIVQAEDFDFGGQNVAYHSEVTTGLGFLNNGQYSHTKEVRLGEIVPLNKSYTISNGSIATVIENVKASEYWNYTFNIAATSSYTVGLNVAASDAINTIQLLVDGAVIASQTFASTGGASTFKRIDFTNVYLSQGSHVITVKAITGNFIFDWLTVQKGTFNTLTNIPGTVEAENYDQGGEGIAYHDTDPTNKGGAYRVTEGVDIETTPSGYAVDYIETGEWLKYAVNISKSGNYKVNNLLSSINTSGSFHIEIDGKNISGTQVVPSTTSWQNYANLTTTLWLPAGLHTLTFFVDNGGFNIDRMEFVSNIPNGNGTGLTAYYFNGIAFNSKVVTRIDTVVNSNWQGSPVTGLTSDNFSVRWTGQIQARYTDTYIFYATSDDGSRVWINNQLLIDDWNYQGTTTYSGRIDLVAGQKYDIKIEYFQGTGGANMKFEWESLNQARSIVDKSQLYPNPIVTGLLTSTKPEQSFDIFPNPASGILNIKMQANIVGMATIEMQDITGRIVNTNKKAVLQGENIFSINVENLSEGLYFLNLSTDNIHLAKKLIINKQ